MPPPASLPSKAKGSGSQALSGLSTGTMGNTTSLGSPNPLATFGTGLFGMGLDAARPSAPPEDRLLMPPPSLGALTGATSKSAAPLLPKTLSFDKLPVES